MTPLFSYDFEDYPEVTSRQAGELRDDVITSLGLLSRDLQCPDLANLPIVVAREDCPSPAYTTVREIVIRCDILRFAPHQLRLYLMHEIMHHVVAEPHLTAPYHPTVTNLADDYVINYYMRKWFGEDYNVKKAYVKGIYSASKAKLGVRNRAKLCERIQKSATQNITCACGGVPVPMIETVARHIRKRFGINKRRDTDLVIIDELDVIDFLPYQELLTPLLPETYPVAIDVQRLARALWFRRRSHETKPMLPTTEYVDVEDILLYGWKIQPQTNELLENTVVAVYRYMEALSNCNAWFATHQNELFIQHKMCTQDLGVNKAKLKRCKKAIDRLTYSVEYYGRRRLLREEKRKYKRTEYKIKMLKRNISTINRNLDQCKEWVELGLAGLIRQYPLKSKQLGKPKRTLSTTITSATARVQFVSTPSNPLFKALAWLTRQSALRKDADEWVSELSDLEDQIQPSDKDEKKDGEEKKPSTEPSNEPSTESEPYTDNGETPTTIRPEPRSRSNTQGNHSGHNKLDTALKVDALNNNAMRLLKKILTLKRLFDTALQQRRSKQPDEYGIGTDSELIYGNDLSKADPAELALLNYEETQMLTLIKIAQHQLTQHVPAEQKRNPVLTLIDCSGSMKGTSYAISVAFGLSLSNFLAKEKRGWMLGIFSTRVEMCGSSSPEILEFASSQAVNTVDSAVGLVDMLLRPSWGGTDFDAAISFSLRAQKVAKWNSATHLLVTDGYADVNDPETLDMLNKKTPDTRLGAVVAKGSSEFVKRFCDDVYVVDSKNRIAKLTNAGLSVL